MKTLEKRVEEYLEKQIKDGINSINFYIDFLDTEEEVMNTIKYSITGKENDVIRLLAINDENIISNVRFIQKYAILHIFSFYKTSKEILTEKITILTKRENDMKKIQVTALRLLSKQQESQLQNIRENFEVINTEEDLMEILNEEFYGVDDVATKLEIDINDNEIIDYVRDTQTDIIKECVELYNKIKSLDGEELNEFKYVTSVISLFDSQEQSNLLAEYFLSSKSEKELIIKKHFNN